VGEREVGIVLGALVGSTVGSGTVKRAGAEDAVTVKGRWRLDARTSCGLGTC
jgi:hypothetical protein